METVGERERARHVLGKLFDRSPPMTVFALPPPPSPNNSQKKIEVDFSLARTINWSAGVYVLLNLIAPTMKVRNLTRNSSRREVGWETCTMCHSQATWLEQTNPKKVGVKRNRKALGGFFGWIFFGGSSNLVLEGGGPGGGGSHVVQPVSSAISLA